MSRSGMTRWGRPTTEAAKGASLNPQPLPQVDVQFAAAGDRDRASDASWDFARISVHPAPSSTASVQAKLVVGSSHDPLERAADAMADRVMSNSPSAQAAPATSA